MEELIVKYPEIKSTPVVLSLPVLWGDMDSANHVNNLIYLRWSETARIRLFETMMDISFTGEKGPILGWHDCKYIFPMTYPDTAVIAARVSEIENDRFSIETRIFSERYNRIAALSFQTIIPYDYVSLKKIPLPPEWVSKLQTLT